MTSVHALHSDRTPAWDAVDAFLNGETNIPPMGTSTKLAVPALAGNKAALLPRRSRPWKLVPTNELETLALQALKAKSKHAPARKQLRWPPLRSYYSKRTGLSYQGTVRTYLVAWGLRMMNDARALAIPAPTLDQLIELFHETIHARASLYDSYDRQGGGRKAGLSMEEAEDTAASAARAVVEQWDEHFIARQRHRGAVGGRKSRRGPSVTAQAVQKADEAAGRRLTHAEVAVALGCSVETVKRRRRELRQHLS